jgi:bifunctional non-homologous end joining protein LigD
VVKVPESKKKASARNPKAVVAISDEAKEEIVRVKGRSLKLTNLNKLYWPKEKITKRDLLNYYAAIASYILPYMKNRPQSMNRHPDGIDKPNFYHKNLADTAPDWLTTFPYTSDSDKKKTNYLVCTNEADLLYMASQGCIEMNPWHSRVPDVDHPDWCVIDLDPDTNTFNKVIETAHVIKQILDSAGVNSYCKTSGSTGLHIYIPLGAKYTYEQSRMLAQLVVQMAQAELPSFTSIERSPAKRKGKIYLDYLQNKTTQTIAAPYSLRPKPGAPVSTPLQWEELIKGLKIQDHNMFNIFDRLKETGDIFKPVLGKGINMKQVLQKIESMQ